MSDEAQLLPPEAESAAEPVTAAPALEQTPAEESPSETSVEDALLRSHMLAHETADATVLSQSRKHTRRSFVVAGVGVAGSYGFYKYLHRSGNEQEMLPPLLRKSYEFNASVARNVLDTHALAPTYPLSRAENLRVNGRCGLNKELVMDSYRMQLVGMANDERHPRYVNDVTAWEYKYKADESSGGTGHDSKTDPSTSSTAKTAPQEAIEDAQKDENRTGRRPRGMEEAGESASTLEPNTPGLLLTIPDITSKLKRYELVTQFKCIEGWSQIVHWAGYRMADFLEQYPPKTIDGKEPKYVYAETPDGDFYNGYDMYIMRHPQTLLVTEMMGAPLTQYHGAPLRLHLPTRYGYKQIKRIGLICYTNDKPDDYWTRLGYDWFGGL